MIKNRTECLRWRYLRRFLKDKAVLQFVDQYSDLFINRFLCGNQLVIPLKKVNDNQPLLYTKLVKEFKFAALTEKLKFEEVLKI